MAALAGVVAGALALAACSSATSGPVTHSTSTTSVSAATSTTPTSSAKSASAPHIMILMMENESYSTLIGNGSASYLNSLAGSYLKATSSYARGHDSLPNYLEMISGNAFEKSGTSGDCSPSSCGSITGKDLADQLQAAGIGWKAYMGAMPSDCSTSNASGSGGYGVRHDPFVYFAQGRRQPECGDVVPASGMITELNSASPPAFVFYSPSICQDGGNDAPCSTLANGDSFLAKRIPEIMGTAWYRDGGTIILTWDESSDSDTSGQFGDDGGHVLTLVISAKTKGAGSFSSYVDTAGILRSVENAYGFPYLGDAARSSSGMLPLSR